MNACNIAEVYKFLIVTTTTTSRARATATTQTPKTITNVHVLGSVRVCACVSAVATSFARVASDDRSFTHASTCICSDRVSQSHRGKRPVSHQPTGCGYVDFVAGWCQANTRADIARRHGASEHLHTNAH